MFEFNGLKNVRFKGSERGNLAGSVQLEDDGDEKRWVFTNTITTFQPGDKIYYWVYVQHNSLGYSLSNQRFTVPGMRDRAYKVESMSNICQANIS